MFTTRLVEKLMRGCRVISGIVRIHPQRSENLEEAIENRWYSSECRLARAKLGLLWSALFLAWREQHFFSETLVPCTQWNTSECQSTSQLEPCMLLLPQLQHCMRRLSQMHVANASLFQQCISALNKFFSNKRLC